VSRDSLCGTSAGPDAASPDPPGAGALLRAAVVVLAGGSGTRVGAGVNKVYLPLAGRTVIAWSFVWAAELTEVRHCLLVVRPEDVERAERAVRDDVPGGPRIELISGGDTRHGSEEAAVLHLAPLIRAGQLDVVVVHDGARPLCGPSLFRSTISVAAEAGGAVPTLPVTGLLAVAAGGASAPGTSIGEPSDVLRGADPRSAGADPRATDSRGPRDGYRLARVQTPQAFRAAGLLAAFDRARKDGFVGTDTASTVERYGQLVVRSVAGARHNLKVTYPHDLRRAEQLLAAHGYAMP
jgi:2-C-methyl-D-erythritol 4-phosphate cytidylyltransferase